MSLSQVISFTVGHISCLDAASLLFGDVLQFVGLQFVYAHLQSAYDISTLKVIL